MPQNVFCYSFVTDYNFEPHDFPNTWTIRENLLNPVFLKSNFNNDQLNETIGKTDVNLAVFESYLGSSYFLIC